MRLMFVHRQKITEEDKQTYTRYSVVSNSACTVQIVGQGCSVFRFVVYFKASGLLRSNVQGHLNVHTNTVIFLD